MTTTPTPRPVPTTEDRMRDARTEIDHAINLTVEAHNAAYHPGQPCSEDGDDRCAALPRRSTGTDRTFATYLDATERDQLDAKAACAQQERDEALDDRDAYKEARDVLRKQLDAMKAAKKRTLGRLEMAEHVIDLIRDGQEQIDRALAAYDTTPGEGSVTITLDNSAGTFTPRHPGDALADALRNAYTTGQLGLLHERVVDLLDDDTPREDPLGRLVDALFAARHKPTPPALGSPSPRAQDAEPCRGCVACSTGPAEREG